MGCCFEDKVNPIPGLKKPIIKPEPQKEKETPKLEENDLVKLNKFLEEIIIQDKFFRRDEDKDDSVYYNLKNYERENLEKQFKYKLENFENNNLTEIQIDNFDDKIIPSIVENENSKDIFRKQIADRIKDISLDNSKYNVEYLTILLVGRKNVGKTTLINYILESENGENLQITEDENSKFKSYKSDNVLHLKLIEFKGIGYNEGSSAEKIGEESSNLIKNLIEKKGTNNYNDFIHCIWYCISGTRFEESELEFLKKLRMSYEKEDMMPIIIVYTQTEDDETADKMFDVIRKEQKNLSCIKTVAKKIPLQKDKDDFIEERGKDELLKETLDKCTKALKGKMINLMINKISNDLQNDMLNNNQNNEKEIIHEIINEFVNDYKLVLKKGDFINYIIKIFILKLQKFYGDNMAFSNKSQNLLNKSKFVQDINIIITKNEKAINKIINPIVDKLSKDFINKQAEEEKKCEIKNIKNKRRLKGFEKTSKIFFENNFYYKLQKYIINCLIQNVLPKYFRDFRKQIDTITKDLLNINEKENKCIKKHLEYCFLTKLKSFADNRNIKMKIPNFNYNENYSLLKNEGEDVDEELIVNEIPKGDNKDDIDENEQSEFDEILNNNNSQGDEQWFTFKNEKNKENKALLKFLQEVNEQESELNLNTDDIPLKTMNKYIKNDLMIFFNSKKKEFIRNHIDNTFGYKSFSFDSNIIKNILQEEKYDLIYQKKFNDEFEILINDNNFTKLDYITVIVIGKSGIGKSTLINHMLKLLKLPELPESPESKRPLTGIGRPVTQNTESYSNENLPFLNLIDTAGMELSKELNPKNILKNLEDADEKLKSIVKEENNNYNKYIQCIWYCIKDSDLQDAELNLIKNVRKKSIPLIIVFTHAINIDNVKKIKNKIKANFKDLPFIDVLAEATKRKASYGLNELLNLTLDVCKNYEKGNIYKSIREIASKKLIEVFKKKNDELKRIADEKIISKFISDYKTALNSKEGLLNFIYDLYKICFLEFLKDEKENKEQLKDKSKEIFINSAKFNEFINNFINHYEKKTEKLIEEILKEKQIKYLDIQVKIEKDENTSIRCENKRDKKDFIKIIQLYLNNYFFYISQKYIINHIISYTCDSFSKNTSEEINNFIEKYVSSKDAKKLFKKNFLKKFDNLRDLIKTYSKDDKIYDCENHKDFMPENNINNPDILKNDEKTEDISFENKSGNNVKNNIDLVYAPAPAVV